MNAQPGETNTGSLAFKKKSFYIPWYTIYRPDYSYRVQESFYLVQKANSGDALAQHELGIRYLLGIGFEKDTLKSYFWIKKAAESNLPVALYNLGIFLNNGWGGEWNPFISFEYFLKAAEFGMSDAEFAIGLLYTENLIVPQDYSIAYYWLKRAAENGHEPSLVTLQKMREKGVIKDTTVLPDKKHPHQPDTNNASAIQLDFIDFAVDTLRMPEDSIPIPEQFTNMDEGLRQNIGMKPEDSLKYQNENYILHSVLASASAGSPEANLYLGRFYETGTYVKKDRILAALYYLRAYRLESPGSGPLLQKLLDQKNFIAQIEKGAAAKEVNALFVYSALTSMGYANTLLADEIIEAFEYASTKGHIPSMIELAQCYFIGKPVERDTAKAFYYWEKAKSLGSSEAAIRLSIARYLSGSGCNETLHPDTVKALTEKGSVIADILLALMYENGQCAEKNPALAVYHYRKAAYRGSRAAYASLKRMYDSLRPDDPMYQVSSH